MRSSYVLLLIVVIAVGIYGFYAWERTTPVPEVGDTMDTSMDAMEGSLSLASAEFQNGGVIPSRFTCDADPPAGGTSPPLSWSGVPAGAQSLALLVDDPDIPQVFKDQRGIDSFDHWTLFNIPPATTQIAASSTAGVSGANGAGASAYTGPCPPPEYEPSEHRYFFRLYALDTMLDLQPGASKADVLTAMQGHIIEQAELVGRYKRQ